MSAGSTEVRIEPINTSERKDYRVEFRGTDGVTYYNTESNDTVQFINDFKTIEADGTVDGSTDELDGRFVFDGGVNEVYVDESETDCCVKVTRDGQQVYP